MAPRTAKRTLYRLVGVNPSRDGMFDALDHARLSTLDAGIHFPDERLPAPSLFITAGFERHEAGWCSDAVRMTGCQVSEAVRRTAGLLLLAVDDEVYAIGFDQGYRLIPNHLKDRRFGIGFAIRQVNPMQVRDLVSHTLGEARTDITIVPGGTPVLSLGVHEHAHIIRRLGGYLDKVELTRAKDGRGGIFGAEGSVGLNLPLGIEPDDLLADIREIARVCREEVPNPALEFVEHIMPVEDKATLALLEQNLDETLGGPADGRIAAVIPSDHWHDYSCARACVMTINSSEGRVADDFDLGYVLDRARVQRSGQRLDALKRGTVDLYRHRRLSAHDRLTSLPALRWIEASSSLGPRRFCLSDTEWYEIGAEYLASIRNTVARVMVPATSLDLPEWDLSHDEAWYNKHVALQRNGYLCLDRKNVPNPLKPSNGVEICDLLAPDDTLVMVKRAHGSGLLSHLFSQGLTAVQLLKQSADARSHFASRVMEESKGQRSILPEDFTPRRVVFAILLKDGTELTPDSLFPFSQITLAQTVKALEQWGVIVEVVGIRAKASANGWRGHRTAA